MSISSSVLSIFNEETPEKNGKMEIGLKCLLIVTVAANVADGFNIFRQSSFCSGQRKYLELGESGQLSAYNISVPNVCSFSSQSGLKLSIEFVSMVDGFKLF